MKSYRENQIDWHSQHDKDVYESSLIPTITGKPTVLFIGAGLSISAGYPLWKELIRLLHEKALEQDSNIVLHGDFKKQAQICKSGLGQDYFKILVDRFDPNNNPTRFTSVHANLVQVQCSSFITTNFDACIELAFEDLGTRKKTFYYPTLRKSELSNQSIQHIHGFIDPRNPYTSVKSVILTSEDFIQAYDDTPNSVKNFLVDLFYEQNVIFLGFNVDTQDQDLLEILRAVNEKKRDNERILVSRNLPPTTGTNHFAILESNIQAKEEISHLPEQQRTELTKKLIQTTNDELKALGVTPIRYNPGQYHKSVENIIVHLKTVTKTISLNSVEAGDII
jgi:hypothetical protein